MWCILKTNLKIYLTRVLVSNLFRTTEWMFQSSNQDNVHSNTNLSLSQMSNFIFFLRYSLVRSVHLSIHISSFEETLLKFSRVIFPSLFPSLFIKISIEWIRAAVRIQKSRRWLATIAEVKYSIQPGSRLLVLCQKSRRELSLFLRRVHSIYVYQRVCTVFLLEFFELISHNR